MASTPWQPSSSRATILDEVYEEYADPETGQLDLPAILPKLDIPDWQQETLLEADKVEAGFGKRYISVPQVESYQGYHDMVDFIDTLSNPRLQARLERAIRGKGAFRRFKDVLLDHPPSPCLPISRPPIRFPFEPQLQLGSTLNP